MLYVTIILEGDFLDKKTAADEAVIKASVEFNAKHKKMMQELANQEQDDKQIKNDAQELRRERKNNT
jgi:hypothetical protein